jgi:PAS domain S-box-containing protein
LLSRVFEASVDSIMVASVASGRIELVNQRFSDLIGIPAAQAVDRTTIELGIWNDNADREQFVAQLTQAGQFRDYPVRMRRSNGEVRSVHVSASVFQHNGQAHSVSIVRDVTQMERDRLEQAAILDNASVGIAFTRNRRFALANARFEEMFGWPRGLIQGQPGEIVWPSAEDYAEIGRMAGPSLGRGEAVELERQMRRRDGSLFWCFLRGRAIDSLNPADGGTIWIAEDITQRRAADAALAAAKEAAEAASRAKSMFLANTSHEIRTPLNGVLGLARLALEPDVDPEIRREYLHRIHDSAEGLSAIITDILDLSKIEAGKLTLETTVFDLRALLDSVFTGYRELARAKGLAFDLAVAASVARHVTGDPVRTRQILSNFVSNAIKFTVQGRVGIEVGRAGDGLVRLSVSDTGIGIDGATRMRLFSPFTQADASTTRRFGGTGLGLSICRQLAELMGGRVGLDSEPGAGSTFWVDLPLVAAATPVVASETRDETEEDLAGLRILVVEDNPVNMLIVDTLLKGWGAVVEQATDGSQAVAAIDRGGGFAAVLMDVHMPVMSGHEATLELRKRYTREEVPIIALTAAALASEQAQSLALGMNDFVSKPFDAGRLLNVLLQVTAHRRKSIARA